MAVKEFKTIDDQILILKERGLIIDNQSDAKRFLLRNNYYRVSGYSLTLRNQDVFYEGVTFQNIIDIYQLDHELRHLLLKYVELIEVAIKSIYAYEFARTYGPAGYLDECNFTDATTYKKILAKSKELMHKRLPNEPYLQHFKEDSDEDIPIWAYVDLFTMSDISQLYKISSPVLKRSIATYYGLHTNKSMKILGNFLYSMTILRNECAHGERLFNRLFARKPSLNRHDRLLLINDAEKGEDNAHLYGYILTMKRMLLQKEWSRLKTELVNLTDKYPFVDMRYYGFRDDWKRTI